MSLSEDKIICMFDVIENVNMLSYLDKSFVVCISIMYILPLKSAGHKLLPQNGYKIHLTEILVLVVSKLGHISLPLSLHQEP